MKGCSDVLLVTMLDEVAWLLNLRGSDVDHNPVFLSYVIVTADGATLFTDPVKVKGEAAAQLADAGVQVRRVLCVLDTPDLRCNGLRPEIRIPGKASSCSQTRLHRAKVLVLVS